MAGEKPGVKSISCPSCGAPLDVRGLGQTQSLACGSCSAIIDITTPDLTIIQKSQQLSFVPAIPLGSRGRIGDIQFQVIGFMVRSDASGMYLWREYLLFNPYQGFRWLMEYNGHWIFYQMLPNASFSQRTTTDSISYQGKSYRAFLLGKARVKFVLGEFYWRVKVGETVDVGDYISPPNILSVEWGEDVVWSEGVYMTPHEIQKSFIQVNDMPYRKGVGACQPSAGEGFWFIFLVAFCSTILAVGLSAAIPHKNQLVYSDSIQFYRSDVSGGAGNVHISSKFEITGDTSNVEIVTTAPVNNSWIEPEASLINATTDESYEGALEMSYYHGYDSDGSWSEGSQKAELVFSSVPAGIYYLKLEDSADSSVSSMTYAVNVRRDVRFHGNLVIAFFLIWPIPLLVGAYRAWFESRRMEESDLGYSSHSD